MAENQLAIATNPEQQGALEVRQQVNQIQYLMKQVLKPGEHYGNVPGTKGKPTLFQSGAEKIAYMFHLVGRYTITRTDLGGGHREYEVTCELVSRDTGETMGVGMASCSTMESKYRYRKKWINNQSVREENPDIADTWNTVLKMAKKRAFVDAVKSTTAASDIFTQDVEDLPPYMLQRQPSQEQPVQAEVQPEPAKKVPTPEEKARMGEVKEMAASIGIDPDEARRYIWGLYQANGMVSVEQWAATIAPQEPEPEPEPDYEVTEPELYQDEIDF